MTSARITSSAEQMGDMVCSHGSPMSVVAVVATCLILSGCATSLVGTWHDPPMAKNPWQLHLGGNGQYTWQQLRTSGSYVQTGRWWHVDADIAVLLPYNINEPLQFALVRKSDPFRPLVVTNDFRTLMTMPDIRTMVADRIAQLIAQADNLDESKVHVDPDSLDIEECQVEDLWEQLQIRLFRMEDMIGVPPGGCGLFAWHNGTVSTFGVPWNDYSLVVCDKKLYYCSSWGSGRTWSRISAFSSDGTRLSHVESEEFVDHSVSLARKGNRVVAVDNGRELGYVECTESSAKIVDAAGKTIGLR